MFAFFSLGKHRVRGATCTKMCARAVSKHMRVARVFRPCNTYYVLIVMDTKKQIALVMKKNYPPFILRALFIYISVRCTGSPATAKFVSKQTRFVRPTGVSRHYKSLDELLSFSTFYEPSLFVKRNNK